MAPVFLPGPQAPPEPPAPPPLPRCPVCSPPSSSETPVGFPSLGNPRPHLEVLVARTWACLGVTIQPPGPLCGQDQGAVSVLGRRARAPPSPRPLTGAVRPSLGPQVRSGTTGDGSQVPQTWVRHGRSGWGLGASHVCAEQRAWPSARATVQVTDPGEHRPARADGHIHGAHPTRILTLWGLHPPLGFLPIWDARSSHC